MFLKRPQERKQTEAQQGNVPSKLMIRQDVRRFVDGLPDWENGLIVTSVSEDTWSVSLGLVIPVSGAEGELVNWLLGEIKSGNRQRFRALTYHETIQLVEGGMSMKSKSLMSNIQFTEVLTMAKANLVESKALSPELLAKLIKFQILVWKAESMKETTNSTPKSDKSPKLSVSGGVEPSRSNRLKYRSGEGLASELIGDEPFSGPTLYVLLFGFHDANLITALEAVNLPLDTVIKVQLISEKTAPEQESSLDDLKPFQLPGLIEAEKILNKTLRQFWKKFKSVFLDAEPTSQLHDVIFQDLQVLSSDVPSIMCSTDIQNSFRASLFTNLSKLMYKVQDLKRQYQNWLNHISFVHVPTFEDQKDDFVEKIRLGLGLESDEEISPHAQLPLPDMQHYASLLENLPSESVSVPIVLHCMIEQVVETVKNDGRPVSELMVKEEGDSLSTRLEKLFDKCMLNVAPPMQFLPSVNTYSPLLIYYGDEIRSRMHHVTARSFDLEAISNALVRTHPILRAVLEFPRITSQQRSAQLARYQNLLSLFKSGEMSSAEIDWVLKVLTFESMALQTSDMHGNINKQFQPPIPWDDPYMLQVTGAEGKFSDDKNFPVVSNFTKGGRTVCCVGESKTRLVSYTSLRYCNDSKDGIQCECMIRRSGLRSASRSNKSVITNSRCNQCAKGASTASGSGTSSSGTSRQSTALRNLHEYDHVEYYPSNVLQQVLNEALNVHHCVDIIYHKRDPCHLLVLHNPFNSQKHCCMLWNTTINTNVYLRNFQLHVLALSSISNWIEKQEAAYDNYRRSQETSAKRSTGDSYRELDDNSNFSLAKIMGDPEWVPQSIVKSLKRQSVQDDGAGAASTLMTFGPGELLRLKMEELNKQKAKTKAESEWKRPHNESTLSLETVTRSLQVTNPLKEQEEGEDEDEDEDEEADDHVFQGYDVGNLILHVSGSTNYLYPGCASQICVEKYVYVEGRQRIKITVYDQGNYVYVHTPIVERTRRWPESIRVVLSDGICVHARREAPALHESHNSGTIDSSYVSSETLNVGERSDASSPKNSVQALDASPTLLSEWIGQADAALCLTLSLPNNLIVQVVADPEHDSFLVRQFFSSDEAGDELCRTVTLNGNVIRTLKKNRTEILQPDGSVLKTDWSLFSEGGVSKSPTMSMRGSGTAQRLKESAVSLKAEIEALESSISRVSLVNEKEPEEESWRIPTATGPPWTVLTPRGRQFEVQMGVWTLTERDSMLAYRATDPGTKEEYRAREDGLHIVHKLNRHYIAHHYEGTRITTYYKGVMQTDTIRVEKPPFVAVTTDPEGGTFNIQLSQSFSLVMKASGTCVIHGKNGTQFAYHNDGSLLFTPDCQNCPAAAKARPFTTFVACPHEETILESYDHLGQQFSVKSNGVITVSGVEPEPNEENELLNRRYVIAYPDGSGSELVDARRMEEIVNGAAENPLCQIDSNLLPGNACVNGLQIFSPLAKTCLDAWVTNYEMDSIVPSGLTSKDLRPISPLDSGGRRYTFGCGVGEGLHVRPVGRLDTGAARSAEYPQVWQLRNLLKFRKITSGTRELFQKKVAELNKVMKQLDTQSQRSRNVDFRPSTEQQLSASLLSLAKATGLPKKRSSNGIKSSAAGAEVVSKSSVNMRAGNWKTKQNSLYRLCSDIWVSRNHLTVYRKTDCLPPFFQCQLGREALVKIKEMPKSNVRQQVVVEEKTPPLLAGAQTKKRNDASSKRDSEKGDKTSLPPRPLQQRLRQQPAEPLTTTMPSWANLEAFRPRGGHIRRARFAMRPQQVDFGRVSEGATLRHRVYLKNNGIGNSAVKVLQPPKETGISVSCTPLLVRAGMQATLDVEIHALLPPSVNEMGEGRVYHELEIRTDIETLYLPIAAKVAAPNVSSTSSMF